MGWKDEPEALAARLPRSDWRTVSGNVLRLLGLAIAGAALIWSALFAEAALRWCAPDQLPSVLLNDALSGPLWVLLLGAGLFIIGAFLRRAARGA